MQVTLSAAIEHINEHGALLVYPIKNRPNLPSLWKCFYPRTEMIWDWSAEGSDKVAYLWHLRTDIALSQEVVYTKWISGRATFLSRDLFTALVSYVSQQPSLSLHEASKEVLSALEDDSPLATKALRDVTGLTGKFFESRFQKALRELWSKLLIVGCGEADEGGFPSLMVGASKLIFEDLWEESERLSFSEREEILLKYIPSSSNLSGHLKRFIAKASPSSTPNKL